MKYHWGHNQHNMFNSSCLDHIAQDKLLLFTACVTDYLCVYLSGQQQYTGMILSRMIKVR